MWRGAQWATVHGVVKLDIPEHTDTVALKDRYRI